MENIGASGMGRNKKKIVRAWAKVGGHCDVPGSSAHMVFIAKGNRQYLGYFLF